MKVMLPSRESDRITNLWSRGRFLVVLSSVFWFVICAEARAEYKIATGDFIEFNVVGIPDLKQRSMVDIDGNVPIPLLGAFPVVGLTVAEVRKALQAAIPNKVYRLRNGDEKSGALTIMPDDISFEVVEYRPVYVSGAVSHPGAIAYRPGTTVRQAIALAGGLDGARLLGEAPMDFAELESEYKSALVSLEKQQLAVQRIRSEQAASDQLSDVRDTKYAPKTTGVSDVMRTAAQEQLKLQSQDNVTERAHIQTKLDQTDEELRLLNQQKEQEQQGVQSDADEERTVQDLRVKGDISTARVTEARRALLFSSSQLLQTTIQIAQAERDREDLVRKSSQTEQDRGIALTQELLEAISSLAASEFKVDALAQKLARGSGSRSLLSDTPEGKSTPSVVLFRDGEPAGNTTLAAEDMELAPGDLVEVKLQNEATSSTVDVKPEPK